ncbi:helix-turn-helix domain-containing protein [Mailhella massiliensis]|uniref:helix-turn-helix domain-containing protein n=1 Tax=Mailhella massiliensis TaxID=1903261 RepID=UPI00097DD50F|nr:helix-turn-helix domain-containing protein [Mailhella massiliensis]
MIQNDLMTVNEKEAARITGFSVKTLQNRRYLRLPPTFLKVGRLIRYRISDLQSFLESCVVEPGSDRG